MTHPTASDTATQAPAVRGNDNIDRFHTPSVGTIYLSGNARRGALYGDTMSLPTIAAGTLYLARAFGEQPLELYCTDGLEPDVDVKPTVPDGGKHAATEVQPVPEPEDRQLTYAERKVAEHKAADFAKRCPTVLDLVQAYVHAQRVSYSSCDGAAFAGGLFAALERRLELGNKPTLSRAEVHGFVDVLDLVVDEALDHAVDTTGSPFDPGDGPSEQDVENAMCPPPPPAGTPEQDVEDARVAELEERIAAFQVAQMEEAVAQARSRLEELVGFEPAEQTEARVVEARRQLAAMRERDGGAR